MRFKKFKKFTILALTVLIIINQFAFMVSAFDESSTEETETQVYKSSDSFSVSDGDGTWNGGMWIAQKFDGTSYTPMTNSGAKGNRDKAGTGNADVYYGTNVNNSPNLNAWWVTCGINRADWTNDSEYAAVKTFSVPKEGNVTISFSEGFYSTAETPSARITVTSNNVTTQIWPESGFYTVQKNATTVPADITTSVNLADKINFEISIPEGKSGAYYTKVYWDPVIEYKTITTEPEEPNEPEEPVEPDNPDEPDEPVIPDEPDIPDESEEDMRDANSYLSSEFFSVEKGTGKWDTGIWSAQLYDPKTDTYTNMTNSKEQSKADKDNLESANVYYGADQWNSGYVGAYWMTPSVKLYPVDSKHSSVKTFTSPKTGDVTVGFDSYFYATDGMKSGARIVLESNGTKTKIWPSDTDYYELTQTKTSTPSPINLELKKGDKIHFEISRNQQKMDYEDPYYSKIYWDPKIVYQKVYPDLIECSCADNAVDVALDSSLVLKYSGELVNLGKSNVTIYEIDKKGIETISKDTTVKEVIMEENNSKITVSFNNLKPETKYAVNIASIRLKSSMEDAVLSKKIVFTTKPLISFSQATTLTGSLLQGENTIYTDIVNNTDEAVDAALIAFVCKGTLSKYVVESASVTQVKGITDTQRLSVTVNVENTDTHFVKVTLTKNIKSAYSYTPLKMLTKGE